MASVTRTETERLQELRSTREKAGRSSASNSQGRRNQTRSGPTQSLNQLDCRSPIVDYILVVNDTDAEIDKRLRGKSWPVNARTPHTRNIREGDRFVVYRGGKEGHMFIATAIAAGQVKDAHIPLRDSHVMKKPVSIGGLLDTLSIIKNPHHYGVYLVGGIVRINEVDYATITRAK